MSRIYPSNNDVVNAIQNPTISIKDPTLKGYTYIKNNRGRPLSYSGGYSIVFPFQNNTKKVAVRCWIASIDDIEDRLREISSYLKQAKSPYFVNFEYINNGIAVNGQNYPLVRMDWVEGLTLKEYVKNNLKNPQKLEALADSFVEMCTNLHSLGISHGDLQHGNIMIRPDDSMVLIDYDSVFVPQLKGKSQVIAGLESYQHPLRKTTGTFGPDADYFSELIIYLSIKVLAKRPDLWESLNLEKEDNSFLFTVEDLAAPKKSGVFKEIENLGLSYSRLSNFLTGYLVAKNIDGFEPLEDIVKKAENNPWDGKKPKPPVPRPVPLFDPASVVAKFKKKKP